MIIRYFLRVGIVLFGGFFLVPLSAHAYVDPGTINVIGGFLPVLLGSAVIALGVLAWPLKKFVAWFISKMKN